MAFPAGGGAISLRSIRRLCKEVRIVFLAALIYALTIYCAITAQDHNSPLGLVSASHGILILHILSKAGDIALAAAARSVWKSIQWALTSRTASPSLSTIFALSSSTRAQGLLQILRYCKGSLTDSPRIWSFLRFVVLLILPGPGTILMSDINVENVYYPIGFAPISGGMGVFDPQLVDIFKEGSGPYISRLVQTLLRDPAISFQTTPISSRCKISSMSCTSSLLPGGVESVSPWPFNVTAPDESDYITQDGPSYQIDFGAETSTVSWSPGSCHVYGSKAAALQLCIQNATDFEAEGQLLSGWRICPTILTTEGDCDQPNSWNASQMWTTSMTVYRRTATIASSRVNWAILNVEHLSAPTLKIVDPTDLFHAFDAILTLAGNQSSVTGCSADTPEFQLTNYLYIYLNQSSAPINQTINIPLDYLRNLLVVPLYLCNPVMLTASDSPTAIQPGLPQENYLQGSYAVPGQRAVAGRWTVWSYISFYGLILLIMFAVLAVSSLFKSPETSSFPIADLWMSTKAETRGQGDQEERMNEGTAVLFNEVFAGLKPGDNKGILTRSDEIRLRLLPQSLK